MNLPRASIPLHAESRDRLSAGLCARIAIMAAALLLLAFPAASQSRDEAAQAGSAETLGPHDAAQKDDSDWQDEDDDAGDAGKTDNTGNMEEDDDDVIAAPQPSRLVAVLDKPWAAVDEDRLDEMRGGFDAGGLVMSFGIERAVYINGNLVTTTSFNISDVGKITSDQMKTLSAQAASMGLVQNGPGNTFQLTTGNASLPGSVIQNTLNNQNIKSTTVINATTNSLNLIRGINTLDTFNNAVTNSLGAH